jgi:hypothetical protein
MVAQKAVN